MAGLPQMISFGCRIVRLVVGSVFLYAGAIKILDPFQFSMDIQNYRLVPFIVAAAMAVYLPWVEIVCGISLIFKKWYSGALALLLVLVTIFIFAIGSAWARGLDITCGCFNQDGSHPDYLRWLLRDFLIFLALGGLAYFESKTVITTPALENC